MRIDIIGTNRDTEEYAYALQLKRECESFLLDNRRQNNNDILLIMPNYNLHSVDIKKISLLLVASFDRGLSCRVHFKCDDKYFEQNLYLSSFCFAVNIAKDMSASIEVQKDKIIVHPLEIELNEYLRKMSFSVYKFINENSSFKPFIVSCIAFTNLVKNSKKKNPPYHLIARGFPSWSEILEMVALEQGATQKENSEGQKYYLLTSGLNNDNVEHIGELSILLDSILEKIGPLTKQKLDSLLRERKELPEYYSHIGNKLILLKGAAGTGKTMRLLEIAHWLAMQNKSCLFLSYNRALVQDINRLLDLSCPTSSWQEPLVEAKTIHSYFYNILDEIINWQKTSKEENSVLTEGMELSQKQNFWKQTFKNVYLNHYFDYLQTAREKINMGYIPPKYLSDESVEQSNWRKNIIHYDYIMIDEAQDWYPEERDILYKQFGTNKFIISVGDQQLIRTHSPLNWEMNNGNLELCHTVRLNKKSLRQNATFCSFQRIFADKFFVPWDVQVNEKLQGGRIIVYNGNISYAIAEVLQKATTNYSQDKYDDILFLSPSDLICKEKKNVAFNYKGKTVTGKDLKSKRFSSTEQWSNDYGINLFDMTYFDSDSSKQPKNGEYRLINYESCRGLESFSVVALDMDVFFDEKIRYYREDNDSIQQDVFFQNIEQKSLRYAVMWSLIVFSRPVELLMITIRDVNSEFYRYLKEIAIENPQLIEFVE